METITVNKIFSEEDLHCFLLNHGFSTNYKKHTNETGVDIIAIKDGHSFLIEFKLLELRDNGSYRYSEGIFGDVLMCSTPKGIPFFVVNEKTSLTKTARLLDLVF